MSLALNGEHVELAQAVRGWAARNCPRATVRAAADGPDATPADPARYAAVLAPSLGAQGLLGLHLPEDCGGQGYGLPELAIAVEELGRALVPGGFLPTVLASALLAAAAVDGGGKLLAGLADGSRSAAVSLAPGLTASRDAEGGLIVDGVSSPVAGAALADVLILPVRAAGRRGLGGRGRRGPGDHPGWTAWTCPGPPRGCGRPGCGCRPAGCWPAWPGPT